MTGFEAFWNDIPAVWKGIGYGVVLFIAMEWTRRTATGSVPAVEGDDKASAFTTDQLFELEKLDRNRKQDRQEFLQSEWFGFVIAGIVIVVALALIFVGVTRGFGPP